MTASVVLLTIHLLGVGVLVGVVFASLYYVLKIQSVEQLKDFISLRKIGAIGATVAILAGIGLAWSRAGELFNNPLFLTKMGLVLADGVIAELIFLRFLQKKLAQNNLADIKGKLLPWAIISALVVTAIIAISVYRAKSTG